MGKKKEKQLSMKQSQQKFLNKYEVINYIYRLNHSQMSVSSAGHPKINN